MELMGDAEFVYVNCIHKILLGGGFKYVYFHPYLGKISHFDSYFLKGLKPPTRLQ